MITVIVQDGRYELQVEYGYNENGVLRVDIWGATEVTNGSRRQLPLEVAAVLSAEFGELCYEAVVATMADLELGHRIMMEAPETLQ